MKVIIASPLKENKSTLLNYFKVLEQIEKEKIEYLKFVFLVDKNQKINQLIKQWSVNRETEIIEVEPSDDKPFIKIGRYRDLIIEKLSDEDYIFWVDGDISNLPKKTLTKLIKDDYDIISPLLVNKKGQSLYCFNPSSQFNIIPKNEIVDVEWVYGTHLVKQKVYKTGLHYSNSELEEHLFLCLEAKKQGFTIGIDTRIKATHGE